MARQKSRTLLLWEESPERVRYFLLPGGMEKEDLKLLQTANGHMINVDDTEEDVSLALNTISDRLARAKYRENPDQGDGVWLCHETKLEELQHIDINRVFHAGFAL